MKAEEKWSVSGKFAKTLCRFMNEHLDGWKWVDIATLMLIHAEGVIKLCIRSCVDECKRNPCKTDALARKVMKQYAEMPKAERERCVAFADDEDEPSSQQEKSGKTEGAPDDVSTMPR